MKKVILLALASVGIMTAQAQKAYMTPGFADNWSFGLDGGVTTTVKGHAFFPNMRGAVGAHLQKQISPSFALGAEGIWGVNTSSWYDYKRSTAFDNSYVGMYGAINLFNLFGGYKCDGRFFDIEVVAGAGWGHEYANDGPNEDGEKDFNYFSVRAGLNFNFNINRYFTVALKPYILYNQTGSKYNPLYVHQTTAAYDAHKANINILASVSYHFGGREFECVEPRNQAEIDALNSNINNLRAAIDASAAQGAAATARANALASEIAACEANKKNVANKVADAAGNVRYVMYGFSSSRIPASQIPVVEMTAENLKSNPKARCIIDGYASPEGNRKFNERLAAARAESVKKMLVNKYGISADRITTQGKGVSEAFEKRAWNRVAICTVED
ncbi:MAG: OmpA family protein [Paramuribaculum sp.]|nr:OmpA family protein [Paramuribaculum sp.]